jgi:hypothetical protein
MGPSLARLRRETVRIFRRWTPVLPAAAMAVAPALRGKQIAPEGTTVQLLLLRQKSVQQELKLGPELSKKIDDFTNKESDAYRKVITLSTEERQTKFGELEKENLKFLEDTLTTGQRQRFEQITLQVAPLEQLTRPDVARVLNLTEEQKQKFKELQKEAHKELEDLINARDREGRNEELARLRERIDNKIDALLTDEQKAKTTELEGEPFTGELLFEGSEK